MEVSSSTIIELNTKVIYLENGNPKIKHSTLCSDCGNGCIKNFDASLKITILQCSWVNSVCESSFHCWKVIVSFLIKSHFGQKFLFHSNLNINLKKFQTFQNFIKHFGENAIILYLLLQMFYQQ